MPNHAARPRKRHNYSRGFCEGNHMFSSKYLVMDVKCCPSSVNSINNTRFCIKNQEYSEMNID